TKQKNKKDKSEMDDEIADTKTTAKPEKQKKVETNKRNKIKAGDQEGDKKTTKAKKVTAKKKPPSKEKAENTLKPVENPKTGWWDD
ncbi:MAG: hypothetical protein VX849_03395, partial [Pseudomonadota bacterium]|nr:hypothetical protein [Pseudomonadota bacterium]